MLPGEKNSDSQSHSYPILQKEERKKKTPLFLIFSSHILRGNLGSNGQKQITQASPFFQLIQNELDLHKQQCLSKTVPMVTQKAF